MKVCHFITYYLPVTQNWIYNQLIHNRECRPSVLCQRLVSRDQFPLEDVFPICQSSGPLSVPARLTHKIFERYPSNPHSAVINKIKPDILHGHFLLESWRNYHLVKRSGIPLVTTCYGQDVTSLLRKPFWAGRSKKVFELGAAFMVEGECMAGTLAAVGCPREKIRVVKLGVDTAKIGVKDHESESTTGNDKVRILFAGLGREKKGAPYAVEAFIKALGLILSSNTKNVDLELHLLGNGVYSQAAGKMLCAAGVRDKAVFHGMQPVAQYLELLKSTDILLAPSVRARDGDTEGGAPVTVIEALCAGIPVVGSRHCDIPNIVSHGTSGLLSEERDADALARDIVTLSSNRRLRIDMGENGARYAMAEHDIAKQVKKITEVYKETASMPNIASIRDA